MPAKNTVTVYDFYHLQKRYQNYAGFSFESISTLIHQHLDFYELILITSGEWQHTIGKTTESLPAGSLLLFKPGITHQLFTEPFRSTHFVMCVEKEYFEKRVKEMFPRYNLDSFDNYTQKSIGMKSVRYLEHLGKKLYQNSVFNMNLAEEVLFLELSFLSSDKDSLNLDVYTTDIIQKLNNQLYMNTPANEIYDKYPCSATALLKHFRERTGMSVAEYRTRTKLQYACQLLEQTDIRILDIATALQYSSLSFFFKTFKAHMKMTPDEYRKTHSNNERKHPHDL